MEIKPVVLFIIDTLEIGGAERSILEISSRFQKYRPVVLTLYKGSTLKNEYLEKGVEVKSLDFSSTTDHSIIQEAVEGYVAKLNPVIIHATLIRSCFASRKLKNKNSFRLINSLVNNTYGRQRYRTLSSFRALKLFYTQVRDAISVGKVDLFFSNSQTIKNTTARALSIEKSKIKVIYRGREPKSFQGIETTHLKEKIKETNETLYTCVGRLIERKGQLDLVEAFAQHNKVFPDTKLILVGEGPFRPALEAKITELKLHSKVELLGQRSDIPEILAITDFFVFPSYYEGLPGALVEAMFSKIPIIASGIPENLECVDEETSLIFNPGDIQDLISKLNAAVSLEWQEKTKNAYIKAVNNFSIAKIVKQYEATYDQLLYK